jgi:hypothetical protein
MIQRKLECLYMILLYQSSWTISTELYINFNFQIAATFFFFFLQKFSLLSRLYFKDLSAYKISWSHFGCYKFCIYLITTAISEWLKLRDKKRLYHETEFYESQPTRFKVVMGDTDQQTELWPYKLHF